jgi:hypothetical protein
LHALVLYASSKSAADIIYSLHIVFFLEYIKCVIHFT